MLLTVSPRQMSLLLLSAARKKAATTDSSPMGSWYVRSCGGPFLLIADEFWDVHCVPVVFHNHSSDRSCLHK